MWSRQYVENKKNGKLYTRKTQIEQKDQHNTADQLRRKFQHENEE